MTELCGDCNRPRIDLTQPDQLHRATLIYDVLVDDHGGRVELQRILIDDLWDRHRVSNGTAHAYIEAMAAREMLAIEYHGPGRRWKRVVAVRRPVAPSIRNRPISGADMTRRFTGWATSVRRRLFDPDPTP